MNQIEISVLNPEAAKEAEKFSVFAARLTQRGHKLSNAKDVSALFKKPYSDNLCKTLMALPHPTIQKFGVINVVVTGASRRFLAQITRHQNEVKFMSASLQYSDYSGAASFVVPYSLLRNDEAREKYIESCQADLKLYEELIAAGVDNDSAGYAMPQSLRNILLISATPFQWKHMISQRICRRNTPETRYVMLKIWEQLYALSPALFDCKTPCMGVGCNEGKMSCGLPYWSTFGPREILKQDFPLLMKGGENENKTY